jgi:hypothetical protein
MHMDGEDWDDGAGGESFSPEEDAGRLGDEDGALGPLTLDGGDGDGDGDGDADSEEEDQLECMAKILEKALENVVSELSPDERLILEAVVADFAYPQGPGLPTNLLKPFYVLLVNRNKQTGVPLYSSSALYQAATPQQQQMIQTAISQWDAIPDNTLYADLAQGLDGSTIDTEALKADLILAFQFARLVDNAQHQENDTFLHNFGTTNFLTLILTDLEPLEDPDKMADFMSTYSAPKLGTVPFATGAQAILIAWMVALGYASADELQKCLEGGE